MSQSSIQTILVACTRNLLEYRHKTNGNSANPEHSPCIRQWLHLPHQLPICQAPNLRSMMLALMSSTRVWWTVVADDRDIGLDPAVVVFFPNFLPMVVEQKNAGSCVLLPKRPSIAWSCLRQRLEIYSYSKYGRIGCLKLGGNLKALIVNIVHDLLVQIWKMVDWLIASGGWLASTSNEKVFVMNLILLLER